MSRRLSRLFSFSSSQAVSRLSRCLLEKLGSLASFVSVAFEAGFELTKLCCLLGFSLALPREAISLFRAALLKLSLALLQLYSYRQ